MPLQAVLGNRLACGLMRLIWGTDYSDLGPFRVIRYDKGGEEHFNIISALHKSLRNSDAQAGLYWLARMLEGGEDVRFLTGAPDAAMAGSALEEIARMAYLTVTIDPERGPLKQRIVDKHYLRKHGKDA